LVRVYHSDSKLLELFVKERAGPSRSFLFCIIIFQK